MFLIRSLIYKDKKLDDFEIDSNNSIFKIFYEILLTLDETRRNPEKIIRDWFNDACYICTIALTIKMPELQYGYFRDLFKPEYGSRFATRADVVLSMVYFLLKYSIDKNSGTEKFMKIIETNLCKGSLESHVRYKKIAKECETFQGFLPSGYFTPINITKELLKKEACNWKTLTYNFDKRNLEELVSFWKDPRQRNLIIDDIESEVNNTFFEEDTPF